jgi:hypothetical protein
MDKLEKYIREHRDKWDDLRAPQSAWNKIEQGLDRSSNEGMRKTKWSRFILILISIVVVIGLVYTLNKSFEPNDPQEILQFAEVPDFLETEQYYKSSIDVNLVILKNISADATLLDDLSQLDENERELRAEYQSSQGAYREEILQALILNHQTKLGLLQRVLDELKNIENENDEFL